MPNYHINLEGRVLICRATKQSCEFGENSFFTDKSFAKQTAAERIHEESESLKGSRKNRGKKSSENNPTLTSKMAAHKLLADSGDAFRSMGEVDVESSRDYAMFVLGKTLYRDGTDKSQQQAKEYVSEFAQRVGESTRGKKFVEHLEKYDRAQYSPLVDEIDNAARTSLNELPLLPHSEDFDPFQKASDKLSEIFPNVSQEFPKDFPKDGEARVGWSVDGENANYPLVPHIKRSVDWTSSLTSEEHDAVAAWTSGAPTIAGALLGDKNDLRRINVDADEKEDELSRDDMESYMQVMDSALKKARVADGEMRVVYRGINQGWLAHLTGDENAWFHNNEDSINLAKEKFPKGSEFSFGTFASCSDDADAAARFGLTSNIVFEIKTSKSGATSAISSWYGSEREALLPRDAKFRVLSISEQNFERSNDKEKSMVVIQLEDID